MYLQINEGNAIKCIKMTGLQTFLLPYKLLTRQQNVFFKISSVWYLTFRKEKQKALFTAYWTKYASQTNFTSPGKVVRKENFSSTMFKIKQIILILIVSNSENKT